MHSSGNNSLSIQLKIAYKLYMINTWNAKYYVNSYWYLLCNNTYYVDL